MGARAASGARFIATVCALGLGLSGCGGVDGGRYTIDGVGKFATAGQPESNMTMELHGAWRDGGSDIFPSLGGSDTQFSRLNLPVGPWAPTSDPYSYTFSVVVEVSAPSDGEEPSSAYVYVTRPSAGYTAYGTIVTNEVSEAEDGWIPVHIAAAFDFTNPWY